jgi:hypothetical protein
MLLLDFVSRLRRALGDPDVILQESAADLEVDVVEGERVAEALGEAVGLDCVRHGGASFVCAPSMRARADTAVTSR